MAIYTDFFLAQPDEVESMDLVELGKRPCVLAKGIGPEEIAQLDFLSTGATDREPALVREEGDGTVVLQIANAFVTRLAKTGDRALRALADDWDVGSVDDAAGLLKELRALARRARKESALLLLRLVV